MPGRRSQRAETLTRRSLLRGCAAGAATLSFGLPSAGQAEAVRYRIDQIAEGFDVPWSLAFLPDGAMLVTERDGRLLRISPEGDVTAISGLPAVAAIGQGGLLDVVVAPDYAQSNLIYLSYSRHMAGGAGVAISRATLRPKATKLQGLQQIFSDFRGSDTGRHFGGRLVLQGRDYLFLTIGDMGVRDVAQDVGSLWGKVLRLTQEGRVPDGNPFNMRRKGRQEIWSLGHRNPQGAALDDSGQLWTSEHGARGGDEVNRIEAGANYGWPVISYGRHYSGRKIGEGTAKRGMQQPQYYWDPSIAPSGLAINRGEMFPEWRGDLFVGSLKLDHIARLSGRGRGQVGGVFGGAFGSADAGFSEARIQTPETNRVRDVRVGPDGALWFLSEGNGALYRLSRR
ncbi:PQQ-dependent sugar dehydrogenase [Thalassobius sp. Cn5-15]|uniref:PQQ-dependent sugar dehydrogenase n=1 Tax=Thalassobius sp. Cn5-15 TaxID=2917763 RepID=UPI001EF27980|nr:PQQ-dependent sugar dehydrogenase [Thalassobius sp. Cn5-15]MCG7492259.1 PQQ-dependent sugar dehydrogenase [Thalassobius sp. Cn5-15]